MSDQSSEKPADAAPRSPHTPGDLADNGDTYPNETAKRRIRGWRVSYSKSLGLLSFVANIGCLV